MMPELPDVEGFRRVLAGHATQRKVRSVQVRDAQVLRSASAEEFVDLLTGRFLATPERRGKWLLTPTSATAEGAGFPQVLFHFGMTGMLLWCAAGEAEHDHDRIVMTMDGGELRYRDMRKLTGVELARDREGLERVLSALGPDACEITCSMLSSRLTRSRRQIKSALMDQATVAGLGNLCVDEILWRARVHPRSRTTELDPEQRKKIHARMRSVLKAGSRAGHVPDRPSWLTGHRGEDEAACPRCAWTLCRGKVAGRTTVWCPRCQRGSRS